MTAIFIDSQSALDLSRNPIQPGRNLHIHARYFYVRDLLIAGSFAMGKISSNNQIADVIVTFKGTDVYNYLLKLTMGCAMAVPNEKGEIVWDTSLLF